MATKDKPRPRTGDHDEWYDETRPRLNDRMEQLTPQEEEMLKSRGWYSHLVLPEDAEQQWVNYHTHGLPELYGQLDFQFVLPVNPQTLHRLASTLVERVKKGERFGANMRLRGVMENHDVLLLKTHESQTDSRQVLRVILPDKNGNVDKAKLSGIFAAQFEELLY